MNFNDRFAAQETFRCSRRGPWTDCGGLSQGCGGRNNDNKHNNESSDDEPYAFVLSLAGMRGSDFRIFPPSSST